MAGRSVSDIGVVNQSSQPRQPRQPRWPPATSRSCAVSHSKDETMSKFSQLFGGSASSGDAWKDGDARSKRAPRAKIASATAGVMVVGAAVVLEPTGPSV